LRSRYIGEMASATVARRSAHYRPCTLALSFLAYIGHPAYGLEPLGCDLDRFTTLRTMA